MTKAAFTACAGVKIADYVKLHLNYRYDNHLR